MVKWLENRNLNLNSCGVSYLKKGSSAERKPTYFQYVSHGSMLFIWIEWEGSMSRITIEKVVHIRVFKANLPSCHFTPPNGISSKKPVIMNQHIGGAILYNQGYISFIAVSNSVLESISKKYTQWSREKPESALLFLCVSGCLGTPRWLLTKHCQENTLSGSH